MEESFVQWNLCLWFEINDIRHCATEHNKNDQQNTVNTVEFLLAENMYRTSDSATYLQMDKLASSQDLRPEWTTAQVSFPVTFLLGDNDHYTNVQAIKQDFGLVQKASPDAVLYIVKGKHGFPLMYPEYIYELISNKDMSKDPLTKQVIQKNLSLL